MFQEHSLLHNVTSESEQLISRTSLRLTWISLEYKCWDWHLYNLPNMSRSPAHLWTLWDHLLTNALQWYKEPRFIDPFQHISCLAVGTNYLFASTGNRTCVIWVVCMSALTTGPHCSPTLREECSQTNVILQYKLLAAILSIVCNVIQQS